MLVEVILLLSEKEVKESVSREVGISEIQSFRGIKKGYSFKAAGAGNQENRLFCHLALSILIAKSIASLNGGAFGSSFFKAVLKNESS